MILLVEKLEILKKKTEYFEKNRYFSKKHLYQNVKAQATPVVAWLLWFQSVKSSLTFQFFQRV